MIAVEKPERWWAMNGIITVDVSTEPVTFTLGQSSMVSSDDLQLTRYALADLEYVRKVESMVRKASRPRKRRDLWLHPTKGWRGDRCIRSAAVRVPASFGKVTRCKRGHPLNAINRRQRVKQGYVCTECRRCNALRQKMRRPEPMRQPPSTSNPEAAALIVLAQSKCVGCAQSWRLDLRRNSGFTHSGDIACTAPEERIQLREIARKAKENERDCQGTDPG